MEETPERDQCSARRSALVAGDPAATASTRERLLLAAERLIADEGLGRVSLRRIIAAAGQRNASAVHYHFGSMDAVIRAILAYRMPPIDRRRNALLDAVIAQGRAGDLTAIVEAAILPAAEQILSAAGGSAYIRFLASAALVPRMDSWGVMPMRHRRGMIRVYRMVGGILTEVPAGILHVRLILAARQMVQTLADVDRVVLERHADRRDALVRFHSRDLIARTVGALAAPVSPVTLTAWQVLAADPHAERHSDFGLDAVRVGRVRGAPRQR